MGDPLIPTLPHQLPHGGLDEQMLVLLHSLRLAGRLTQPQSSVIDLRVRDTCKPGGAMWHRGDYGRPSEVGDT